MRSLNTRSDIEVPQTIKRRQSKNQIGTMKIRDNEHHSTRKELIQKPAFNLNEIITKNLVIKDPKNDVNRVYYNSNEKKWDKLELEEDYIDILNLKGKIIHKNDRKYNELIDYHKNKTKIKKQAFKDGAEFQEPEEESIRALRNHLTFASRISQTMNPKIISREVCTKPLDRTSHDGILHRWEIFDKYIDKFIAIENEEKIREEILSKGKVVSYKPKPQPKSTDVNVRPSLNTSLKLMERQIMQIVNSEDYRLYREWDKNDEVADARLLLMLLGFPHKNNIKNKSVTALCWNTKHEDLFAVGYGSYKFPEKGDDKDHMGGEGKENMLEKGRIAVFSIKNNYYPEMSYTPESGVLCLDFHPTEPSYLVAGLYDGNVQVYDIKLPQKTCIISCDIRRQKHLDPVWQVRWFEEEETDSFAFFSCSTDGRLVKWSFKKSKTMLENEEILSIKYSDEDNQFNIEGEKKQADKGTTSFGNVGCMCFDFNKDKNNKHLLVMGTEEGHLYLCSVQHRGHYITKFKGHSLAVYTVSWNPYHSKVFASCSADWTIKLWHYKTPSPLISFDLQNAVGDISWSPWCSTIFAGVTVKGETKFFDINTNRKKELHEKKFREISLNHIVFSRNEHVFITGNDKGKVRLWRMAQRLRNTIDKKEEEEKEKQEADNQKNTAPSTKIIIPRNLVTTQVRTKKIVEIKVDKKSKMLEDPAFIKAEKERIEEFLKLLDIDDY